MNDQIIQDSVIATVDQLNLFQPPIIQTAIEKTSIVEFRPTTQLTDDGFSPVTFSVGGDSRNYIDLSRTRLHVDGKIVLKDGSILPKASPIAPVNLTLQSLWSAIELKISGKTVSMNTNGTYPYIAYLKALIKESDATKTGQLTTQVFSKDRGGLKMDKLPSSNSGFQDRQDLFAESAVVSMEGPLSGVDLWSTPRYVLCNTPIDLTLFRSRPEFFLQSTGDKEYKFVITNICLKIFYIHSHPGILLGHANALSKIGAAALYPFMRTQCKTFNIPAGSRSFRFDNIFNQNFPQRILCAFVKSDAFSGKKELNPFLFHHFDLRQIEISADGISVPSRPMTFKFDEIGRGVVEPYLRLYDCIGASGNTAFSNGLSLKDFAQGYAIFGFPMNGGDLGGNYLEVMRSANICIQGTFGTALDQSVTLILYSESSSVAEIDSARNITVH